MTSVENTMSIIFTLHLCCCINTISLQNVLQHYHYKEGLLVVHNIFANKATSNHFVNHIRKGRYSIQRDVIYTHTQYNKVDNLYKLTPHTRQRSFMRRWYTVDCRVNSGRRTAVKINISGHTQNLINVQCSVTVDDIQLLMCKH